MKSGIRVTCKTIREITIVLSPERAVCVRDQLDEILPDITEADDEVMDLVDLREELRLALKS